MGVVKLSEYRHGTNRFVCQNPVSESEVCGYAWELAVPDAGKVDYQIACLRCWHAYEITVKAPKPPRPPKHRQPQPKPICHHDHGRGYVDHFGRPRCCACGEIIGKARATDGTS